jgi:hypothetical protein
MSFDRGPRPPPSRRWNVRLFETSDKLEEHLNRSELRPEQVTSISVDGDGFFVLVYWVGPPPVARPPMRPAFEERRPPPRRRFDDEGDERGRDERGFDEGPPPFERPRRAFDREGFAPRRPGGPPRRRER